MKLASMDEYNLVTKYNIFLVQLNLVCQYFIEDFYIDVHKHRPLAFFSCSLYLAYIRVMLESANEFKSVYSSFVLFLKKSLINIGIHSSFECLVEFCHKAIWSLVGRVFITTFGILLVIGLFGLSISSKFCRLYISRNLSISYRLSNLLHYSCS